MKTRKARHVYYFESGDVSVCTSEQAQEKALELAKQNNVKSLRYKIINVVRHHVWHEVKNASGIYEYDRELKKQETYYD